MINSVPGFDLENIDQSGKKENQQEQINRSVISKTLRILSLPNADRNGTDVVLEKFLKEVVKYDRSDDPHPLTWVKLAGANDSTMNLKVDMTSLFWDHFIQVGRKNLFDYNRQHGTSIKVFRGQTIQVSDLENLSLYLRKKIRYYCVEKKLPVPEIVVKNSFMMIKGSLGQEVKKYKSTELAILLGWSYDDWHGTPIKKLMTANELKNMEAGSIVWGSLKIEEIVKNQEKGNGRKRAAEKPIKVSAKMAKGANGEEQEKDDEMLSN